jgi:hypothetical protein
VNHSKVRKFTLAGLIALPLLAVIAVAFSFAWGQSSTEPVSAAAGADMSLIVKGGKTCIVPGDPPGAKDFCVVAGNTFDVTVNIDTLPGGPWLTGQAWVDFGALVYKKNTAANELGQNPTASDALQPDCGALLVDGQTPPARNISCTGGNIILPVAQAYTGAFASFRVNCGTVGVASLNTISLLPLGDPVAGGNGSGFVLADGVTQVPEKDSIIVRCQVAPTATATNTATNTNTPTSTFTPTVTPAAPSFVKCAVKAGLKLAPCTSVHNLFLTRQGTKIPPVQCIANPILASADKAVFQTDLDVPVTFQDPKGTGKVVNVGAFEFEVNYDANKVCVDVNVGQAAVTMTCFIQDSVSKPILEGVARIGCVTVGKKVNVDGIWNFHLSALGGALQANCTIGIQEAPLGQLASGIFPVKGAMLATGPAPLTGANCTGSTPAFGWIVPGGGPLAAKCQVTGPMAPCNFNNQTGDLVALIPCVPPNLGPLCQSNGSVSGNFFQEPTTHEMAFDGTFVIDGGTLFNKLVINGTITGARKSHFALKLATVTVYPQPDLYSQGRANQDNGNVVQIANKKCELSDDQGHPIPQFACNDAEVTIRYLEGDVEPDCRITSADTQAIAFRWGSEKGSLVYNDRFNLEPGGTQADLDIDIKDLQFVYGRFGSTCKAPWPAQVPINAKQ